ncbi:MAG: YihY/virulence factor BrkB family protein [Ramlibacter sp.]|nr:YihY/virulence factor BrkB family protein [Ramlibacter sp.]
MNYKQAWGLVKKAVVAWIDDFAPSMGAAISYYTVFSLAPLLVIVIALAGAIFGREAVTGQITGQLAGLIGAEGAKLVQGLVASASDTDRGLVAGAISSIVLLIGATTVFAELQSALDRIWHVPEREKPHGLWAIVRARVLSFGLILGLAFMLMVSLAVGAATAALGTWVGAMMPGSAVLLYILNLVISLAFSTVLFAMIFKLMPTVPVAWRDVWIGAAVTAALFEVGKLFIGLYIGRSGITESFQAAGSLVVLLAWVYYAAQIFLLGAEFTKVYADEHGSAAAARATEGTQASAEAGVPIEAVGSGAALAGAAVKSLESDPASVPTPQLASPPELGVVKTVTRVALVIAAARVVAEVAAVVGLHLAANSVARKRKSLYRQAISRWKRP